jgi:hypothetical protein
VAGILSQPTGKFPEGARQPRLIVLGNRALPLSTCVHCAFDNGSEIEREGWVRWVRTGSVG